MTQYNVWVRWLSFPVCIEISFEIFLCVNHFSYPFQRCYIRMPFLFFAA